MLSFLSWELRVKSVCSLFTVIDLLFFLYILLRQFLREGYSILKVNVRFASALCLILLFNDGVVTVVKELMIFIQI